MTPKEYLLNAHHWLILHGRYLCKARSPECWRCSIVEFCKYKAKTPAAGDDAAKPLKGKPVARKAAKKATRKVAARKKAAAR